MRSIVLRLGVIAALAVGAAGCGGDLNALKVGDCFDPPAEVEGTVTDVVHHACTEAHGAEVVFVGDYTPTQDSYPITIGFQNFYAAACTPAFNAYTGLDFDNDPTFDMAAFKPTIEGWGSGDRKVICYAMRHDNATMSQSIKKS